MRGHVIVIGLLGAAACGRAPIPKPPPAAVSAAPAARLVGLAYPGESAEFVLSFRGFVVGRATVVVGDFGWLDGRRVVVYHSRGATEGLVTLLGHVRWELETTIDLDRGVAISDREDTVLGLGPDAETIVREHSQDKDNLQHDIQSAVCAIRGWKSRIGDRTEIDLVFASARLDVEMWDAGRGYTDTALVPAVRFEGTIDGDTGFVAWMSDDADRVPLEVRIASEWGDITIELAEYRAPHREAGEDRELGYRPQ